MLWIFTVVQLKCFRDDAKANSIYSKAKAPQGAIDVYLTTTGRIYHSAGLCNHRNVILYCIVLKIYILKT